MIRLASPSIDDTDLAAVCENLLSGYLVQGKTVAAFESALAEYVGAEHAIAVNSGTSALLLALMALGIGRGDKVGVATYSFPATANAIVLCGAEPVFIDIDPVNFNIAPAALEDTLKNVSLKALIPVHTFGGMADMDAIMDVAEYYRVPVVEDAACALGARLGPRNAGTFGVAGCFSFHPRKAITTGEGGLITTNDATLARQLRMFRNHGQDPDAATPDFVVAGFNMRLTEYQAALGLTQLKKINRIIDRRRRVAAVYDEMLRGGRIKGPQALPGCYHVYQSYVVLLPDNSADRASVMTTMAARGIETTIGTYHVPLTSYFRKTGGFAVGDFSVTDDLAARALSLPISETLTTEDQVRIVSELEAIVHSCR